MQFTDVSELRRIDDFPFSKLQPADRALVHYSPQNSPYAGRHYLLSYIVPEQKISAFLDKVRDTTNVPGRAMYTQMVEVLVQGNGRDVDMTSDEFEEIFREAIEQEKGTILVDSSGRLVKSAEDLDLVDTVRKSGA